MIKNLHTLIVYCSRVAMHMGGLYREAGMDVIEVVDPLVSQISHKHFTNFLSKDFIEIFSFIRSAGAFSAFFVCGDATKNIEVMCQTARQLLFLYQAEEMNQDAVILPDYSAPQKPLMEVFTLDSDICLACGYMMNAAQRAFEELTSMVDMVEFKITNPKNAARMLKPNVKNLPSILINREVKFSSLIPSNRELVEEIRKRI